MIGAIMRPKQHKLYTIWSKMPVDYYQKSTKKNILQKYWHGQKIKSAKKVLSNYDFKKCLDVGCASGYMVSQIAKIFPDAKYYGVDVYDKAIKYAQKKYPHINFKVAFAHKLPFNKDTFDAIIFYETIEHVEDPAVTLKELRRVLKKKGVLVLAMDSGNWLFRLVWFFWENSKGKIWQGAHLHPFHHDELEKIIKKAGFKIKRKFFTHAGMEVTFELTK